MTVLKDKSFPEVMFLSAGKLVIIKGWKALLLVCVVDQETTEPLIQQS